MEEIEKIIESIYELFGVLTSDIVNELTVSYTALCITMLLISISGFIVHYYVIDNVRWDRKIHLWISSALVTIFTIVATFLLTKEGSAFYYLCIINGLFSLILMVILTSIPILRSYSTNCKHTTFWKP